MKGGNTKAKGTASASVTERLQSHDQRAKNQAVTTVTSKPQ